MDEDLLLDSDEAKNLEPLSHSHASGSSLFSYLRRFA